MAAMLNEVAGWAFKDRSWPARLAAGWGLLSHRTR